ncbi:MAG: phytanoyl-CoA dioxygenase family protein [Rhodothermales bacterium]|nr:phytanoyl-CoA dioxygenase family protein [Rhodothermales bacterium]
MSEVARQYREDGFVLAKSLFSEEEVSTIRDHFMALRISGSFPGDMAGIDAQSDDPLVKYPRMIHMHRWDSMAMDWLISDRIQVWLRSCLESEPLAVQSMLYFKPAGARGQALHQDQHFIRVDPGEAIAAWMALDVVDEQNGCLQVVRGSHKLPVLCAEKADTTKSFTDVGIHVPEHLKPEPVKMSPGDVLFFHGHMIHGSFPNTTTNRFRRSLIGHYVSSDAVKVADYYHPVLAMDGSEVTLDDSPGGGPCGTWVDVDGRPVVQVV